MRRTGVGAQPSRARGPGRADAADPRGHGQPHRPRGSRTAGAVERYAASGTGSSARTGRTHPTGSPPPSSGSPANSVSSSGSTPRAGPARRRPPDTGPVRPVGDLHRDGPAVGQRGDLHALEAVLGEQPRHGPHERGDVPAGAGGHLGVLAHRVGDPGLGGAGRGRGDPGEGAGEAVQGDGEQRGAAAVHGDPGDALAGQLLDGRGDGLLERVRRVQVVVQGPAVEPCGPEHGRVLAGAVLGEAGGQPALADPGVPGRPGRTACRARCAGGARRGPASSRMRRVPARWRSSPEWLAAASDSSSPSSGSPARSMATAWRGLTAERG